MGMTMVEQEKTHYMRTTDVLRKRNGYFILAATVKYHLRRTRNGLGYRKVK